MGVDSGLPDFRGSAGFWQSYPALAKAGIDFNSIASPRAFRRNPIQAWGFYGHRLALYRGTEPHAGFFVLKKIAEFMPHGVFVVTSNVDGQFQKAGYQEDRILEIHGSIHNLQCNEPCFSRIWSATDLRPSISTRTCHWLGRLPTCRYCGGIASPNILMFDDDRWISERQLAQRMHWEFWRQQVKKLVVIECGAGIEIPSIRRFSEKQGAPVIRINPHHARAPMGMGISLPLGAEQALSLVGAALGY